MHAKTLQRWAWVHKWSALVSGIFLLILCVTGLPLIFADEINGWLTAPRLSADPANSPSADIDRMVAISHQKFPDLIVANINVHADSPQVVVSMIPSWQRFRERSNVRSLAFDARTGEPEGERNVQGEGRHPLVNAILQIHRGLFAGIPGGLFLGLMSVFFIAAVVSGLVIYAPYMRNIEFGTVRSNMTRRLQWFDIHKLLGGTTFAWLLVVGLTGFMNEMSLPLFAFWEHFEVRTALAPWHGMTELPQGQLASVKSAVDTTQRALPDNIVMNVMYPGFPFGSPRHYILMTKGNTFLTSQMVTPVLVDAESGALTMIAKMPWYLRALELSRPLHFGNYGGLLLKIIWALLDIATIVILGSGVYLWLSRRAPKQSVAQ